jgi:lantibiotic transport system permease protein
MLLAMVIVHFADPSLELFSQPFDATRLLVYTGNAYVTILALCAFQFWLGLRFRNFIIPIGAGLVLWIVGIMLSFEYKPDLVHYYPYSFQNFPYIPELQSKMTQVALTSVGYAVLFLWLGFLDFRRRRLTA